MYLKFPFRMPEMPPVGSIMTIEHPTEGSGEYIVISTGGGHGSTIRLKSLTEWQEEQMAPHSALVVRGEKAIRPEPGERLAAWMKRVRALMCEL